MTAHLKNKFYKKESPHIDVSPHPISTVRRLTGRPSPREFGFACPYVRVSTAHRTRTTQHNYHPDPAAAQNSVLFRSQIEISPVPAPSVSHPAPRRPATAARQRSRKKKDGLGAVLPALRRQPLGGGHLGRHGRALRGDLLAPHLPHRHLQLPPRLHRAPLPQARLHEVRLRRQWPLLQLQLLPARRVLVVAGQEDGPRRDQPQGRRAGAVAGQAQVRRRRGRRALRRLRPAQLALRGPCRRQAALRARAARPAHEPPRHPRERSHGLLHGLPLLPLLHQHQDQPAEAARLRASSRGRRGRRWALPHARSESKLSCVYTYQ